MSNKMKAETIQKNKHSYFLKWMNGPKLTDLQNYMENPA